MALQLAHVSGQRVTVRNLPTRVLAQVPCWERRRTPSHRDGDGDRDRTRLGIASTCAALALPRATHYRWRRPLSHRHARSHPARSATRNAPRSSACCTSRALWTWLPRKSMRRCSTRGGTSASSARCIASRAPPGGAGAAESTPASPLRGSGTSGPPAQRAGLPRPPGCPAQVGINPPKALVPSPDSSHTRPLPLAHKATSA
jgi:hypothetical protein